MVLERSWYLDRADRIRGTAARHIRSSVDVALFCSTRTVPRSYPLNADMALVDGPGFHGICSRSDLLSVLALGRSVAQTVSILAAGANQSDRSVGGAEWRDHPGCDSSIRPKNKVCHALAAFHPYIFAHGQHWICGAGFGRSPVQS